MAGAAIAFEVHVAKRGSMTEVMAERLLDLSPAFKQIVSAWGKHNADKFGVGWMVMLAQ